MNAHSGKPWRLAVSVVALGLSLACAGLTPATGGGATAQPTSPSAGQAAPSACDFPTDNFVNVAGSYAVKGGKTDQSGGNYTGDATITLISKNCFGIAWHLDGGRTRTGTLQMVGNIISGQWQEGSQSGVLSGTASTDHLAIAWGVGTSEAHNTDYSEILTKK
jgi:hypothetical protein